MNVSPSWSTAQTGPFGESVVALPAALVVSLWSGENVNATTGRAGAVEANAGAAAAADPASTAAAATPMNKILFMWDPSLSSSMIVRIAGGKLKAC